MKEYSKEKTMQKPERKVQQLTLCGLFTALTAIGAFIQISIPVEPFPMHFTHCSPGLYLAADLAL